MFALVKTGVGRGILIFLSLLLMAVVVAGCVQKTDGVTGEPPVAGNLESEDLFASSTGDIHDYMPDLLAGKAVSGYDLLPCLANFTHETWAELNKDYGPNDWWSPLLASLRDASVSEGREQNDYGEQALRNYYLGKAVLASDGAYSEGLMDILVLQWNYDAGVYSSSLSERFTEEEETTLRRYLSYSQTYYNKTPFVLYITDTADNKKPLCLGVYPVDFPFYIDLNEIGREDFRAESFGTGTIVEGDGLQVKYLNPDEGVYNIITIRSVKQGDSAVGVAIGDTEEMLHAQWQLAQWQNEPLNKLDSISYDDEAWFGNRYDYAYTFTHGEGTKSVVFLIKDSLVCGIELIDGLDGSMY